MKLCTGNMWTIFDTTDHFIFTGNAFIRKDGALVMGRGIAREVRDRHPGQDLYFGGRITHLQPYHLILGDHFGVFQVKHHFSDTADLGLIGHSVIVLAKAAKDAPTERFDMNFPGIGNGHLAYNDVLPLLENLPDNVHIWTFDEAPAPCDDVVESPPWGTRLIIAGGRDFNSVGMVVDAMADYDLDDLTIISGTARGADQMGEHYAKLKDIPVERYPAKWKVDGVFNKAAGYQRNDLMATKATHLLAFWDGASRGTKHMIDVATKRGLEVRVVKYVNELHPAPLKDSYVVHCKRAAYDVYIGRGGPWGNPFVIGQDGDRDAVISKYEHWLLNNEELMEQISTLRGKTLGCWCSPKACHGDVLARIANK